MKNIQRMLVALALLAPAACRSAQPIDLASPPQHLAMELSPTTMSTALSESQAAAQEGLTQLRQLAAEGSALMLGFFSAQEAALATLGTPRAVMNLRLDQLRTFRAGDSVEGLLSATSPQVLYPVLVGERVRSSITVTRDAEQWSAGSFGLSPLAKLWVQSGGVSFGGAYVVHVPALSVFFAASGSGRDLTLTPLEDYPLYGLKKGTPLPAEQALLPLVEAAQRHNGLPA
jgi:hypothetical protein